MKVVNRTEMKTEGYNSCPGKLIIDEQIDPEFVKSAETLRQKNNERKESKKVFETEIRESTQDTQTKVRRMFRHGVEAHLTDTVGKTIHEKKEIKNDDIIDDFIEKDSLKGNCIDSENQGDISNKNINILKNSDHKINGRTLRAVSASKRATQNRNAQRTFRQRKEKYIKDLEAKATEMEILKQTIENLEGENMKLRNYTLALQSKVIELTSMKPHQTLLNTESPKYSMGFKTDTASMLNFSSIMFNTNQCNKMFSVENNT